VNTLSLISQSHISRYFCDFDKRDSVTLDAPSVWRQLDLEYPPSDNDSVYPKPWDSYNDVRSIVLLGPPRAGKTTEFKLQCENTSNGFIIELRDVDFNNGDLITAWDQTTYRRWKSFISAEGRGELFIDSLDEGRLETKQAAKRVVAWLKALGEPIISRLRVHLSCREFEWNHIDQGQWEKLFPSIETEDDGKKEIKPSFMKLALLPLDSSSISSYLEAENIDEASFNDSLPNFAERLTHWPQSLCMLSEVYSIHGHFTDINSLYSRVIEKRIQESNERRVDEVQLPLSERLNIAQSLAAISYLSGREIIALNHVDSSKEIDAGQSGSDMHALKEIAGSELFESFTEGKVRFEDRSIAAFLAAKWLVDALTSRAINSGQLITLLYADPKASEVVPSLRSLAGWLAAMSLDARNQLLERSPNLLLSDDYPSELSNNSMASLWEWMKSEFGHRKWFDRKAYESNAGKLVCDAVIKDVGNVLGNRDKYGRDLQIFALEILLRGQVKSYGNLLLQLILDQNEDEMLRCYSLRALTQINPEKIVEIRPLLEEPSTVDDDLDVLGTALFYLYPDYLSVDEVLRQLQRTKRGNSYGMFQSFANKVAVEATADDRAIILNNLERKLSEYLSNKERDQGNVPDWTTTFDPALEFDDFLLAQLKVWGSSPDKFSQLESWLHLLANANTYGLLTGHNIKEITKILESNHELRRQCAKIRIERLFELKGKDFKPYDIHLHDRLYFSQAEDLEFWKGILIDWAEHPANKLEAAWNEFWRSWDQAGNQPAVIDWIEEQAGRYPSLSSLWELHKVCPITKAMMGWKWKQLGEEKKTKRDGENLMARFHQHIDDIRQNKEEWVRHVACWIYNGIRGEGDNESRFQKLGKEVQGAFKQGLIVHWQESATPDLSIWQGSRQYPSWIELILMAVDDWLNNDGSWDLLEPEMRRKAIIAAFSGTGDIPAWFFNMVALENNWAKEMFCAELKREDVVDSGHIRLLNSFSGFIEEPFVLDLITDFLKKNSKSGYQMIKQLLRLLCDSANEHPADNELLDYLWKEGLRRIDEGEYKEALLFSAVVFRYRQMEIWNTLDQVYLDYDDRPQRFIEWLNAIEDVHLRFRFEGHWPAWIKEEAIAAMIPDMFNTYSPVSDPDFLAGNQDGFYRVDMGRLRDNALSVLAESGTVFSGEVLFSLLDASFVDDSKKSWVWHNIDLWKSKRAQKAWIPLNPEDVIKVIYQGHDSIRSPEELFKFVCELLEGIRKDIESGEEGLQKLLWNGDTPKIEKEFQSLLGFLLRKEIDARRLNIVSGRELDIKDNFPDLFTTCILPDGTRSRVFLEMKRQQFYEKKQGHDASTVLTSIKTQLIDKYLADADTSHGVYIVGWYGMDYFGSYKTKLKKLNRGTLPTNPNEFEKILQKVADDDVRRSQGVKGVRVFVIDLVLNV
jgi:hypothetical protein